MAGSSSGSAERISAHLRGLWRALWREPRALCRDARNPEAGVDRGQLFLQRQVLQLRQRQADAGNPIRSPGRRSASPPNSADTFPAIAKLGHGVFVAVRLGTLEELEPNITAYRKAWKEAGHPGEGKVFLRAPVYIAEPTRRRATSRKESIMYFYRYLGERLEDFGDPGRRTRGPRIARARGQRLQTSAMTRHARKDHRRLTRAGDRSSLGTARERSDSTASCAR